MKTSYGVFLFSLIQLTFTELLIYQNSALRKKKNNGTIPDHVRNFDIFKLYNH